MTLDRTIAPPIKDVVEFNLLLKPYQQFNLNNGAPVYYLNDGTEGRDYYLKLKNDIRQNHCPSNKRRNRI